MSKIVELFNVNRKLYTVIILVVGIVAGSAIWNLLDDLRQSVGIFARPEPFKIAAAGDWGCGYNAQTTLGNIKSEDPEVILSLGDMSYEGAGSSAGSVCENTDKWIDMMRPFGKKLFLVIGNHDISETSAPNLIKRYVTAFRLCPSTAATIPSPCEDTYSFTLHKVHFLILNSEFGYEEGSSQYLFAERDLKKASADPNINWIIVAYHSARYASIDSNAERVFNYGLLHQYPKPFGKTLYTETTKDFLGAYHPLFDKYGVDIVLQAHSHSYQRTYPLKFNGKMEPPIRTSIATKNYNDLKGEIYLTVGTGGVGLNELAPTIASWISCIRGCVAGAPDNYYVAKMNDSHYGFLELSFRDDGSSVTGTFYGNDAREGGSIALDKFSIIK